MTIVTVGKSLASRGKIWHGFDEVRTPPQRGPAGSCATRKRISMLKTRFPAFIAAVALCAVPSAALAYIGPGVGAGAIAAVLGVLGSIYLAIVAVIYYPIKRLMKGRKSKAAKTTDSGKPAA